MAVERVLRTRWLLILFGRSPIVFGEADPPLETQDFLKIFDRIEDLDRAGTRFARMAGPVSHNLFNSRDRTIQIADKTEPALARQILPGAAVLGNNRSSSRQERCRPIA